MTAQLSAEEEEKKIPTSPIKIIIDIVLQP